MHALHMATSSRIDQSKDPNISRPKGNIFVIGHNQLQNELLVGMLQKKTGFPCFVVKKGEQTPRALDTPGDAVCLALFDCMGMEPKACLEDLEKRMTFLYRNEIGEVLWAYPVTVDRTPHKIRFSTGERLFAA